MGFFFSVKTSPGLTPPHIKLNTGADFGGPELSYKLITIYECKSIIGIVIQLKNNTVVFSWKIQSCVSESGTMSELYAARAGITHIEFISKVIRDIFEIQHMEIRM
jgi:hypothetical protein